MTATFKSRLRTFHEDHRGAIMVLGIFFACMMIGWMWMLVGLGDAMIWRDRSQEAADAAAYSSSAVQAKAMNLISFVNLIMLVLTFIYLLMAFLWNFLDLAHTLLGSTDDASACIGQSSAQTRADDCSLVADALDCVPYLDILGAILTPICDSWVEVAEGVQAVQGRYSGHDSALAAIFGPYEKFMASAMPIMSTVEDVAAKGGPWAGEVLGIYNSYEYKDWNQPRYGAPLSATLLPASKTSNTAKWTTNSKEAPTGLGDGSGATCDAQNAASCASWTAPNGEDYREYLPVEITDQGMSDLCYADAQIVDNAINNLVGGIPLLGQIVALLTPSASSIRDKYCEMNSNGYFEGFLHEMLNFPVLGLRYVTWLQDGGTNNSEDCPNGNWGVDSGGGSDGCGGGPDDCEGVYQIHTGGSSSGKPFWHNRTDIGGPHLVVEYAENGNDWFQVWGFVWGGNRVEQSEKLVGLAGMDSTSGGGVFSTVIPQNSETLADKFNIYVAQSEFYFDCNDEWDTDACNSNWAKTSFQMSWRSRLRRTRDLTWKTDVFNLFTGGLASQFESAAAQFYSLGSQSQTQSILGQFASQFIPNTLLSGAFIELMGTNKANVPGGAVNPQDIFTDVIH